MATAGVLEKNEKRAYLDDTTPLHVSIVNHRVKPKENYVVSTQLMICVVAEVCVMMR